MRKRNRVLLLILLLVMLFGTVVAANGYPATQGYAFQFYYGEQYTTYSEWATKDTSTLYLEEFTSTLTTGQNYMWVFGYLNNAGVCTAQSHPANASTSKKLYYTRAVGTGQDVCLGGYADYISGQVTGSFTP